MEPPGGRDSRFNLGYSMNLLSGETAPEIYGNPNLGRPSTSLQQLSPRHTMVSSACGGRGLKSDMYDERGMSSQNMGLDACGVNDISEDTYSSLQSKKSPPSNGKKTKGRVKIKMEYIENKLRRYTTFSKRKTGIMKKAYELSTLTGTQVMLLVASETGHVYTFATRKLQPMITSEAGKALIQTCLNSPDPPVGSAGGDQRMSATGFEETELTYNISDEDSKDDGEGYCATSSSSDDEDAPEENSDSLYQSMKNEMSSNLYNTKFPNTSASTALSKGDERNKSGGVGNQIQPQMLILPTSVIRTESQATVTTSAPQTSMPSISAAASVPLLIQSNSGGNIITPTSSSTSASQIQALPLLVQTPAGVGYATTPEGMVLGLLQGPNLVQPQLVAIPVANSSPNQNAVRKENGPDKR